MTLLTRLPILSRNARHFGGPGALTNLHMTAERILTQERIVAVALLTESDLTVLGPTFTRAWPVEDAPVFGQLLQEIDKAEIELSRRTSPRERLRAELRSPVTPL